MLDGLIVSCQAVEGEPLYGYNIMGVMAKAAVEGGAIAIRTSSVNDVNDIKDSVNVPVIGLIKRVYNDSSIYITPTLKEIKELLETDCEVIALDATDRTRPNGEKLEDLVRYVRGNSKDKLLMADIATVDEAKNAEKLGFDFISTTLRGYTENTKNIAIPDMQMIAETLKSVKVPVIAEGGIWEIGQLEAILKLGVHGVVIGTAVTRPRDITARFAKCFK